MASGAFQVGDRVRVVKDEISDDIGRTGTVLSVDSSIGETFCIQVTLDTLSRFPEIIWFGTDELELITRGVQNASE